MDAGFKFHHAKDDYLLLTQWLPTEGENKIPGYASHYIGVGGVVMNKDKSKLLCIQERRPAPDQEGSLWKLPGGLVDPGESIE